MNKSPVDLEPRSLGRHRAAGDLVRRLLGSPPRDIDVVAADAQAPFGAWFDRHERALRVVAVVALCWGVVYLTWRIGWSWNDASPALFAALLVCEIFGLWSLGMQTWFSHTRRSPVRPPLGAPRDVDIYICTYDEPIDVLEATLVGAECVRYPHKTYVLDDGRRPAVAELAHAHGAEYLTRPDNLHAKAGNINAALPRTHGELVLVLDADHVPMPDALDAVVGYFDEPDVAVLQTPHDFYNQDSVQHYGVGRHEQSVFFRVTCPGKDRHRAAFWCGSASLLRREALLEIGGVATETIAEDFHTSIRLQSHGWSTRYHDELLVQGLAPHDLSGYLMQRDRWARGNLAVMTTPENPLRAHGLTWQQRLSHLGTLSAYLAGPVRLLTLLVLAVVLWTGLLPMTMETRYLIGLWLPWIALSLLAGSALSRGFMRIGEAVHFEQLTGAIYTRALRCVVRPGRAAFRVTPKEGVDLGGWQALRQLATLDVIALLILTGVVARLVSEVWAPDLLPSLPGIAVWLVPVLGVVELRRVLRTLSMVSVRRQRRSEFRFSTRLPVDISAHGSAPAAHGTTLDLSAHGIRMRIDQPIDVGDVRQVVLRVPQGSERPEAVTVELQVLACRPSGTEWVVRAAQYDSGEPQTHEALVAWCYVWSSFERVRGAQVERRAEEWTTL